MRDFSGIAQPEVYTLSDLVHRLELRSMSKATDRTKALLVRAIQDAIRSMPGKHPWNYYRRQSRFVASPSVGMTIVYDHTGGAYERLVTSSTNPFPSDASYGHIRIGDRRYRVEKKINAQQAVLESDFSLRADYSGDATWERRAYQFSRELEKVHYVHDVTADRPVQYLTTSDFSEYSYGLWGAGSNYVFTWQNHGNAFGSSEFILLPSPISDDIFEVSATVKPHIPKIHGVNGTAATINQGSKTVVCTGAAFTDKLIGCVFRLGRTTAAPIDFNYDDWEFQAFVVDVEDSTTLTLSEAPTASGTNRGYDISSPIDIETSIMLEALEDEAYFQYCKNHDHKSIKQASDLARSSILQAIRRDNKVSLNSRLWTDTSARFFPWTWGFFANDGILLSEDDEDNDSGGSVTTEKTYYLTDVPASSFGEDDDQVYITAGDLEGAVYEKQGGVWTYINVYQLAVRDSDPNTAVLPAGFRWRLANQTSEELNGIWEWDGYNAYQRVEE